MDTERVILVDEHDRELGTAEKLDAHVRGLLHRAVSVLLFDAQGRTLLQRRAAGKYHSAGLWANACCSHPHPGEDALAAAHRRLREELGIDAPLVHALTFTYRAEVGSGLVEHEVDHVFTGRFDGEPRPAPAEVEAWEWRDAAALAAAVRAAPERYAAWLPLVLAQLAAAGRLPP
jgi:isopentenyl-diphosphate Delta-isomerase